MMIVVESMSNGALDSFLRVRFSGCDVHASRNKEILFIGFILCIAQQR